MPREFKSDDTSTFRLGLLTLFRREDATRVQKRRQFCVSRRFSSAHACKRLRTLAEACGRLRKLAEACERSARFSRQFPTPRRPTSKREPFRCLFGKTDACVGTISSCCSWQSFTCFQCYFFEINRTSHEAFVYQHKRCTETSQESGGPTDQVANS